MGDSTNALQQVWYYMTVVGRLRLFLQCMQRRATSPDRLRCTPLPCPCVIAPADQGHSGSEADVKEGLTAILQSLPPTGEIAISMFSSNVARVQTVAQIARDLGMQVGWRNGAALGHAHQWPVCGTMDFPLNLPSPPSPSKKNAPIRSARLATPSKRTSGLPRIADTWTVRGSLEP